MKLKDQVALIIGGARGIGETIAHTFSNEGAGIVLVDLERMKTELNGVVHAVNQKGGKACAITADCSDDRQVNHWSKKPCAVSARSMSHQQRRLPRPARAGDRNQRKRI